MATYISKIEKAQSHDELKAVGAKIFKAKLSKEKKTELVKAYRAKRRELDRAMAENTENSELKRYLYYINTMATRSAGGIAKLGKTLYDQVKEGIFNKNEADLLFRAYRYQKAKAGVKFEPKQEAA